LNDPSKIFNTCDIDEGSEAWSFVLFCHPIEQEKSNGTYHD